MESLPVKSSPRPASRPTLWYLGSDQPAAAQTLWQGLLAAAAAQNANLITYATQLSLGAPEIFFIAPNRPFYAQINALAEGLISPDLKWVQPYLPALRYYQPAAAR